MPAHRRLACHRVSHGGHRHRDGVVVIDRQDRLPCQSSGKLEATVDESIDAGGAHLGLHQHAHPPLRIAAGQELRRGHGTAAVLPIGLFEYLPVRSMAMDEEAAHACLAYSMAELLRTGTTTVMEIGAYEEAVRQAGRVGMRLYMGLGYRSAAGTPTTAKR